jgi:predicted lipoprotein with Yx(FWY)xxD motif
VLYRLDLDRYRARRRDAAHAIELRCAKVCDQLWRPVAAPAGLHPGGDWSQVQRPGGPAQLAYKGDPLYAFIGKSLDEAAEATIAPPYFSSYAAPPVALHDGVPTATLYWHEALYRPPEPKVATPAGVSAAWFKTAYVFADADARKLYMPRGARLCPSTCDGLEALPAPLAALSVGDWRPIETKDGQRVWSFKARVVYRLQAAGTDEPGPDWQALEVR